MIFDGVLKRRERRIGTEIDHAKARGREHGRGEERRQHVRIVLWNATDRERRVLRRIDHASQIRDCLQACIGGAMLDEDPVLAAMP